MLWLPDHLNIETTDRCNRSCDYCPTQQRRDKRGPLVHLKPAHLERVLDGLWEHRDHYAPGAGPSAKPVLKISLQWIDEPLVNPHILELGRRVRERLPFARLLLQTNGDHLQAAQAPSLSAVFHAVVVNAYTEAAYRRLLELELDVAWAAAPRQSLQSPGRLKRPLGRGDDVRGLWHINQKFRDRSWVWEAASTANAPRPRGSVCTHLWTQAAIAHTGAVHICCRDNEQQHPVGHLDEHTLLEAFNSETARRLRGEMEAGRRDRIAMCAGCAGHFNEPLHPLGSSSGAPRSATVRPSGKRGPQRARPGLPFGRYTYWQARALASARGDVVVPGFLPLRVERLAGVTPALAGRIIAAVRAACGDALLGLWVVGGRVMPRAHLQRLDPSVFAGVYDGPGSGLTVADRGLLREQGPDPRHSSDLDLKILVAQGAFSDVERDAIARDLGRRLSRGLRFPLSGHTDPVLRLLEVDASVADSRAAFASYNASRPALFGKGPLSLEYAMELRTDVDASAPVRAALAALLGDAAAVDEAMTLHAPGEDVDVDDETMLRARLGGLSGHQLIGALLDEPARLHTPPEHPAPLVQFAWRAARQLAVNAPVVDEARPAARPAARRGLPVLAG